LSIAVSKKEVRRMVGLVLVSHSALVARGLKEMALQMVSGKVAIEATGGTKDGRMGTDVVAIRQAIRSVLGPDGVVVLADIGGAVISAETALEGIDGADRGNVVIADAPLVEGTVMAATQASLGASLLEVKRMAEEARLMTKLD
jgi:dihydroxyacetone kinase phosphotransfer subunit